MAGYKVGGSEVVISTFLLFQDWLYLIHLIPLEMQETFFLLSAVGEEGQGERPYFISAPT